MQSVFLLLNHDVRYSSHRGKALAWKYVQSFPHPVTLSSSFARSAQVDSEVDLIESVSTPLRKLRLGSKKHLDFGIGGQWTQVGDPVRHSHWMHAVS